jgi:hypothetical protein
MMVLGRQNSGCRTNVRVAASAAGMDYEEARVGTDRIGTVTAQVTHTCLQDLGSLSTLSYI